MENRERTVPVAIIAGVIALLLGLCCGLISGLAGGYLLGHKSVTVAEDEAAPLLPELPTLPITPERPALPRTPGEGMAIVSGAWVREVIADSPAEKAGLEVGDIVTQVDGTPIDENHRLVDVIGQYEPGQRVEVTVWRAGATKTLKATLGANEQDAKQPYLGVRYSDSSMFEERQPGDGD